MVSDRLTQKDVEQSLIDSSEIGKSGFESLDA